MNKRLISIPYKAKLAISVLYLASITTLFVLPLRNLPKIPLFPGEDKIIHAGFYFILAILLSWTFHNKKNIFQKIFGFVIVWGFIMEITQLLMHAGRNFSFLDMLANITGALLGIITYHLITTKIAKLNEKTE